MSQRAREIRWPAVATGLTLALGLGVTPVACDTPADPGGEVTVGFSLEAALETVPTAHGFEVSLALKDLEGRVVTERVVVSEVGARFVRAELPCTPGDRVVGRAALIGAYTGRPPGPQGGAGGLALPIAFVVNSAPFTCGDRDWISLTATPEPPPRRFGEVTVSVTPLVPEAFTEHQVGVNWQLGVALGDAPIDWSPLESGVMAGEWNRSHACDATEGGGVVHVRALRLLVDGVWFTADAWSVPALALPFDCVEDRETTLVATPALTIRAPEATP